MLNDNTILLDVKQELPLGNRFATVADFKDFCFSPVFLAVRGLVRTSSQCFNQGSLQEIVTMSAPHSLGAVPL